MDTINSENKRALKVPQEVRVAITVNELDKLRHLFMEAFGLTIQQEWQSSNGAGVIFKLENATLELLSEAQTEFVDKIEVGSLTQPAGVRLALQVADVKERGDQLASLGNAPLNSPVTTPWGHFNWRFRVDEKLQITLFQVGE